VDSEFLVEVRSSAGPVAREKAPLRGAMNGHCRPSFRRAAPALLLCKGDDLQRGHEQGFGEDCFHCSDIAALFHD